MRICSCDWIIAALSQRARKTRKALRARCPVFCVITASIILDSSNARELSVNS